jgi:iron complex transport system substrate-binding protein
MTPRPSPFRLTTALAAALALTLTGCAAEPGDDTPPAADGTGQADAAQSTDGASQSAPDDGTTTVAADFPVTVTSGEGEIVIEERPERIVSLSPSATEILFAIGAGDQVVAADQFSTYPEEAPTTDLDAFNPNVEAIVGHEPDLVVIASDSNDLAASLAELDIPVLVNAAPTDIESGYAGMADLGLATGHVDETAQAVTEMREGVAAALEAAPTDVGVRVYHELDETLFSASSYGFIGSVYAELGATNVADEADADRTGFPQLTEEAVVEANPQLIVIQDSAPYTAEDVAARPGWEEVDAVRNGNIVAVDADISSRWGPRLPELVEVLAQALDEAAVPAGR